MAVHYRTQGFILKKEDVREADQVFVIYTKDFGKLKIVGKAIRKIKSKLRAGADLYYLSEIEFIQGKTYKTLTDAIVIEKFKNIRDNSEKLKIAYKIAEVADGLIRGQEKDEKIWDLLIEVFEKLNNYPLPTTNYSLVYYYFVWNLLSILGYQIDLYHCVKCQEKLSPTIMNFSSENNGIVCLRCSDDRIKDKILISAETIKIFRLFLGKNWRILSKLKIEQEQREKLEEVSQSYIDGIINK